MNRGVCENVFVHSLPIHKITIAAHTFILNLHYFRIERNAKATSGNVSINYVKSPKYIFTSLHSRRYLLQN